MVAGLKAVHADGATGFLKWAGGSVSVKGERTFAKIFGPLLGRAVREGVTVRCAVDEDAYERKRGERDEEQR